MFKSKKVILAGTILVAGAIAMTGTFAWFTDSDTVVNKMKLAKFDVKLTEDWEEEKWENLEPDTEVDKVVKVTNNGTADAIVRVRLDEALKLFKNEDNDNEVDILWSETPIEDTDKNRIAVPDYSFPDDAKVVDVKDDQENIIVSYYSAITSLKDGDTQCFVVKDDVDALARYNPETEKVEYAYYEYGEETVKDTQEYFTPVINNTDWEEIGEFYYYKKIVEPKEITAPLFSKVTVSEDLPSTYIGSVYTLTPNMYAVQADKAAVESEWTDLTDDQKTKLFEILFPTIEE